MIVLLCFPLNYLLEFCISDPEWDREGSEAEGGSSAAGETSSLLPFSGLDVKRGVKAARMTE